MNYDQMESNWKPFKDNVKQQWDDLTSEDSNTIKGIRVKLAGKTQETLAIAKICVQFQTYLKSELNLGNT